ncbi:MAG: serine hydrolase domain-containing protein [Hyphomonas sp.]|nr:serine hydrolase domain-containing protein [Hyphomonas sp.]
MKPARLAVIFLLAACAQVQAPERPDDGAALLAQAETLAQFSGAFEVTRDGVRLAAGAAGTADGTAPFTLETASDSASLAKPMTAEIVLGLVAEGKLSLDEKVADLVPDYPYTETRVRDLLDHSAALPDYGFFQSLLDAGEPVTTEDLLAFLKASGRPYAPAEETFSYCNLCYDVLGAVAAAVSGEPLGAVFDARLFGPAGMEQAFLRPARFADWPIPRTLGFRQGTEGAEPWGAVDNEGFHGGSNIYLSVRDVTAYAQRWALGAVPGDVRTLALSDAWRPGHSFTLGNWDCAPGRQRCYYSGHHEGFDTFAYWDAERRITAAFVSNGGLPPYFHTELPHALIALGEGRTEALRAPRNAPFPEDLAGWFEAGGAGRIEIRTLDGQRAVHLPDGRVSPLYPAGHGVLYAPDLGWFLSGPEPGSSAAFVARRVLGGDLEFRPGQ